VSKVIRVAELGRYLSVNVGMAGLLVLCGSGCARRNRAATPIAPPAPAVSAPAQPSPAPSASPSPPTVVHTPEAERNPTSSPKPSSTSRQESHPKPTTHTVPAAAQSSKQPPETAKPVPVAPPASSAPLVADDPNVPSADTIQKRINEARTLLERLPRNSAREGSEMTQKRIAYFLDLAARSLARQDLRQADTFSHRALVLAQDLTSGH
jgi:hypothetical protein